MACMTFRSSIYCFGLIKSRSIPYDSIDKVYATADFLAFVCRKEKFLYVEAEGVKKKLSYSCG